MNDNILANTYEFKNKNKINETEGNNNILDNDKEDDDYLLSKLNDEDISKQYLILIQRHICFLKFEIKSGIH